MQLLSWPGTASLPQRPPTIPGLHNPLYRLSRGTGSIKRTASSYKRGF